MCRMTFASAPGTGLPHGVTLPLG